jgi:hypothetical protein
LALINVIATFWRATTPTGFVEPVVQTIVKSHAPFQCDVIKSEASRKFVHETIFATFLDFEDFNLATKTSHFAK